MPASETYGDVRRQAQAEHPGDVTEYMLALVRNGFTKRGSAGRDGLKVHTPHGVEYIDEREDYLQRQAAMERARSE